MSARVCMLGVALLAGGCGFDSAVPGTTDTTGDAAVNRPDANLSVPPDAQSTDADVPPDGDITPVLFDVAYNVGGGAFTGTLDFLADPGLCTGSTSVPQSNEMHGTTDDPVFQSFRFAMGTVLTCSVDVADGNYDVTLFWAEWFDCSPAARKFDVYLEGMKVENDLDVEAVAGCILDSGGGPLAQTYPVTVTGGSLSVDLQPKVFNPMLSAVRIREQPSVAPN